VSDLGTDMARGTTGCLMRLIGPFFKLLFRFLLFIGFFWTFVLTIPFEILVYIVPDLTNDGIFATVYLGTMAAFMVLFTIQSTIKAVTGNRGFRLWHIFTGGAGRREEEILSPTVPKKLRTRTPDGFIFGGQGRDFVSKAISMDGHILTVGGAGSGKSSCIAIPSLLSWESRVFAVDIKGELYEKTRNKRTNIKIFNPMSTNTAGYDPFYLLRSSRNPVQDVREIVIALVPKPADVKEPFWVESAQNLFTGAILHFHAEGLSFPDTIAAIQKTPIGVLVETIHNSSTENAQFFVNQFVGMDTRTLAGIFTELSNKILPFATDPDLKSCLSKRNYITPEDIEDGNDVYLCIPEDKIEQWKGLLTLITNQFLKHFERRAEGNAIPVLFLLDEFARLGKVETVVSGLATLRSKKVTICILTQSLAQLDVIYGTEQRKVIADNCQYKAVLSATDADTQDYFSRLVGTFDKTKRSQSANFEQYTGMGRGTGTSTTTEEKRIIKPEEFSTLKDIVLLTPFGFYRVEKTPYYEEPAFFEN